jgi:Amt family ammonium transporter
MTSTPASEQGPVTGASGHRILVVEDNPVVNSLVSRLLRDEGYEVAQAHDGEEGLRLASLLIPRAIIMDIRLPRMDGFHVLDALKRSPGLSQIPVILTSLTDQPELGQWLGAVDFMHKPLDRDALLARLKELIP